MKSLLLLSTALGLLASPAFAQTPVSNDACAKTGKCIGTGGAKGAYFNTFCPPLPGVLKDAQYPGYKCVNSDGTLHNIKLVMDNPANVGLVQMDVYARAIDKDPAVGAKTTVIRELACEGVWFITKNARLKTYADVLLLARRGSAA